jgi:hypothetical protein
MSRKFQPRFDAELRCNLGVRNGIRTWGRNAPVTFVRPSDGKSPNSVVLRCDHCSQDLTYQVLSVRDAQRWRWILHSWTLAGLVLMGLTILAGVNTDSGGLALFLTLFVGVPGIALMIWAINYGAAYIGMRGPGWLYRYPHNVVAWSDHAPASLVCKECGHVEPLRPGDFQGTRERLARHVCN